METSYSHRSVISGCILSVMPAMTFDVHSQMSLAFSDPAGPGRRPPASGAERPPHVPAFREACPMAAIAADRDLLFGLLALQNGLIDQVELVAAYQAWTRDKARPLAEHLAARGDLDPD